MCDICAKGFFDYEFNSADIDKISNFNEIAWNFTYSWTSKFLKYNWTDTDHLLLKSKFYGRGKSGMYFSIFGSCQPLSTYIFEHTWASPCSLPMYPFSNGSARPSDVFQHGAPHLLETIECDAPGLCCPYTQTRWKTAICKQIAHEYVRTLAVPHKR